MSRVHRSISAGMVLVSALSLALLLSGCDRSGAPPADTTGGSRASLRVVAAENFWGSIAKQLAGSRASVTSIIVNPNTDPHSYEPSAADAREMAVAQLAIINGIGYDDWASRLLAVSPSSGRVELNIGHVLGLHEGDNPHQWYSPSSVLQVVAQIASEYERLDPHDAAYFLQRERLFRSGDLARYDALRAQIRASYAGVPVGYSESIFQPLGEDLGLRLSTPYSFAKAIAEGTDVSAQDKQTVDTQVREHRIAVWVFNSQNVTPDVQRVNQLAREAHIPVATVTETLSPASENFEQWQVAELEELERALHEATGR